MPPFHSSEEVEYATTGIAWFDAPIGDLDIKGNVRGEELLVQPLSQYEETRIVDSLHARGAVRLEEQLKS